MNSELNTIREALCDYHILAQHMHDEVCQSYGQDAEKAQEAIELFDAHVAALSQQEAEPVLPFAWTTDEEINMIGELGGASMYVINAPMNEMQVPLYLHPPKPAALPQPVASVPQYKHVKCPGHDGYVESQSVPQGLEEFIDAKAKWSDELIITRAVPVEDLRTWMAGHARVPVELFYLSSQDVVYFHEDGRPWVLCNDTFYYASADAEDLPIDEVSRLFGVYKKFGYHGVTAWCAEHRGMEPLEPHRTDEYRAARAMLTASKGAPQ